MIDLSNGAFRKRRLLEFAQKKYPRKRLDVSAGTIHQYSVAVHLLDRHSKDSGGGLVRVGDLSVDLLVGFLGAYAAGGVRPRTVNSKRSALLTLWRFAHRWGDVGRPCPDRIDVPRVKDYCDPPNSWTVADLKRLLDACDDAKPVRHVWTGAHWRALILTLYDTAARIGAVLSAKRSQLSARGFLVLYGCDQKTNVGTVHRLHADTIAAIEAMPPIDGDDRLFAWPASWPHLFDVYGRLLKSAGLPHGRKDKFHRLRRTSYTMVYREFGLRAASKHAGHRTDMSAAYLDPTQLDNPDGLEALPRPV